jgi:hypothetical protein
LVGRRRKCFQPVRGQDNVLPPTREKILQEASNLGLIVDDQHLTRTHRIPSGPAEACPASITLALFPVAGTTALSPLPGFALW